MKKIWENSLILILFITFFIFKDNFYKIFYKENIDFNFIKENELNYYKTEYQKLLNIYNMDFDYSNNYNLAKIIYRDIYEFYNEILISKGKDFKIKKGDAVVSDGCLVGVVNKVDKNSSYVNILYNKDLKISVKLNDTYGILESKNNKLYVKNLVSQANINLGDIVYTSGLTNIPKDIPIGKVSKIDISKDKLSLIVEIEEIVNLKNINYVLVISNEESDKTS